MTLGDDGAPQILSMGFELHAPKTLTSGAPLRPAHLKLAAEEIVGIGTAYADEVSPLCSAVMAMIFINALARARSGEHGVDAAAELDDLRCVISFTVTLFHANPSHDLTRCPSHLRVVT